MNKFEVRFKDVQIRGEFLSWTVVLKTFDAGTLIKHLASKGLKLNCFSGGRFADNVSAEEWDENELHGRILRAGVEQIGSFVVREAAADDVASEAPPADPVPVKRVAIQSARREGKTAAAVVCVGVSGTGDADGIPF